MIGAVIGTRYKILSLLGQGAVGQVYLAEHVHLGRKEALKVLRPTIAVDPHFVSRFRREARATNRVQHENIISVYDFGRLPDGRLFLAMEYAEGPALSYLINEEGTVSPARAVHIAKQLGRALHHAHEHGVVHRDIKPSNLLLTQIGERELLKVLDFGMAKIIAPEVEDAAVLTLKGQTFGTPSYMAPEQFRSPAADPRVDIYGAGCVLFELLCGRPPFTGHSLELMQKHETEAPRVPSEVKRDAGIPPELDEVVLTCLQKNPAERYPSGRALASALAKVPGMGRAPKVCSTARGFTAPRPSEFDVDTDVSGSSGVHARRDFATDVTDDQSGSLSAASSAELAPDRTRIDYRDALLELAEALRDLGCEPVIATLGRLHGVVYELSEVDNETHWLDDRLASWESRSRERESSLRFALGELRFDREQATGELAGDIDFQIAQLEARLDALRTESAEEAKLLEDRGIHLAARRAALDESLDAATAALRAVIDPALAPHESDVAIASLIDRYRSTAAAFDEL
ncbi:MAG TPA: serine/threonine-protein kinase [Kofleriaceae bacterium]|nr:serine/threonine-protein kinase [Kofleriaceae bacterium]